MHFFKAIGLLTFVISFTSAEMSLNSTETLSRRKRYVAFPDGSSVSAAICLTVGVLGNPNKDFLSWALNWGVAYNLPNYAWARKHAHGFSNVTKATIQRRSRRDLYEKLTLMIDNMGFRGGDCIERALCESAQMFKYLGSRRGDMIEEVVKTIFRFPTDPVEHHEPTEHHLYDRLFRRAKREDINCAMVYSSCKFSLLELALGSYSIGSMEFSAAPSFM